jgi:uncharacterized caspase-like protein
MGQNYAIVIGINQYDNLGRLKYAKSDAQAMQRWFCESGFEEVYYFAEDAPPISAPTGKPFLAEPSLGKIKNFLDRRFGSAFLQPSDNLWFFFAGHGKRHGEQDYLMLADSNPRQVADTALEIDALSAKFRSSGAGNVILFLDACRNDGGRDGLGIGTQLHPGVITFYACSPGEESFEIDEIASGAFTHALLKGLQVHGEGNCATVERLHNYLKAKVPLLAQTYKSNQQTPSLRLDPETKLDVILLPHEARSSDLVKLKNHALSAEHHGKVHDARDLWIQILTNSPGDHDAIEALERLARNSRDTANKDQNLSDENDDSAAGYVLELLAMFFLGTIHKASKHKWAILIVAGLTLTSQSWVINRREQEAADPLRPLLKYLNSQNWKAADRLTNDILLKQVDDESKPISAAIVPGSVESEEAVVKKNSVSPTGAKKTPINNDKKTPTGNDVQYERKLASSDRIDCETMRRIDDYWTRSSQGKLGLSRQLRIYGEVGGTPNQELTSDAWNKFTDQVGWRKNGRLITSAEHDFNTPPAGHFPTMLPGVEDAIFRAAERCRL